MIPRFDQALTYLKDHLPYVPETALILGSGLGDIASAASDAFAIETANIPGYPVSTVAGHTGRLIAGTIEEKPVIFVQGRVHLYEGHSLDSTTFPVRLLAGAGVKRLLVTNAAGGINTDFPPGTLMFLTGHLNLSFGEVVLRSPGLEEGSRRVPYALYDPDWLARAESIALELGIRTRRGVYAWTRGPSYETPAEIRMFSRLGADAVGMSTVPEVVQAAALGMEVLGLSTITNLAAGLSGQPLSHEEVLETGRSVRKDLERLVRGIVRAV